jgi:hypothetical protein
LVNQWRPSRLPESRKARVALAKEDSLRYVRLMGTEDEDRLMDSLAKLPGVTAAEVAVWESEKYNVALEFVPAHRRI